MAALLLIAIVALCTWGGGKITAGKGRGSGIGMFLGFFLGPLGVLIAALLSTKQGAQVGAAPIKASPRPLAMHRECPHCKERMRRDASVCPHCRMESTAWHLNDGVWWVQASDGEWHYLDEQANRWVAHAAEAEATPTVSASADEQHA
jgi:hypothetical protein